MSTLYGEDGFFGPSKVQEAYNIIIFWFLIENSILKIFGSVDVKITSVLNDLIYIGLGFFMHPNIAKQAVCNTKFTFKSMSENAKYINKVFWGVGGDGF